MHVGCWEDYILWQNVNVISENSSTISSMLTWELFDKCFFFKIEQCCHPSKPDNKWNGNLNCCSVLISNCCMSMDGAWRNGTRCCLVGLSVNMLRDVLLFE